MKKILSTALLLAAVLTASAQEKQKYYVPQKGDWSVGITYNPATMVRDLKMFEEKYDVKEVQPVDMFPFTSHVECVAVMGRKDN